MKIYFLFAGFLAITVIDPLFACDIVGKREVRSGDQKGVAGRCPNNGEKIECYEVGESQGGFTCYGPLGTMTNPNLESLIYAACGCSPEDRQNIEYQMERELE